MLDASKASRCERSARAVPCSPKSDSPLAIKKIPKVCWHPVVTPRERVCRSCIKQGPCQSSSKLGKSNGDAMRDLHPAAFCRMRQSFAGWPAKWGHDAVLQRNFALFRSSLDSDRLRGRRIVATIRATRGDAMRAFRALGQVFTADPEADAMAAIVAVGKVEKLTEIRNIACVDRIKTAERFPAACGKAARASPDGRSLCALGAARPCGARAPSSGRDQLLARHCGNSAPRWA